MTLVQMMLLMLPVAYVAGSIPFGLIIGLSRGVDVRTAGSGNIGATNVGRLLGAKFFALVFLLDLSKGLMPMLAAGALLNFIAPNAATYTLWLAVGFTAILGHMFSVFLRFKGGKGVATSAGVVLGLFPYFTLPALIALGVWIALFAKTKIVSLASIVAALLFPLAYLAFAIPLHWRPFDQQWPLLAFSLLMSAMITFRHRTNISRLRAGTESRFTRSAKKTSGNGDTAPRDDSSHSSPRESWKP